MSDPLEGLREAWAAQTMDAPRFDPGVLGEQAETFARRVRRRNLRELVAGVFVVLGFGVTAVLASDPLARLGALMIALGAVSVMLTLARRGRPTASPDGLGASCLAWRRAELTRERDLLAGVWWWYLGPLVPGFAVFQASGARRAESAGELGFIVVGTLVGFVVFIGLGWLNARAARALDEELRALPEVFDAR